MRTPSGEKGASGAGKGEGRGRTRRGQPICEVEMGEQTIS